MTANLNLCGHEGEVIIRSLPGLDTGGLWFSLEFSKKVGLEQLQVYLTPSQIANLEWIITKAREDHELSFVENDRQEPEGWKFTGKL